MAYGAFQRGHYVTAFAIATQRVEEQKDVKAMTLLGELYANGLGSSATTRKQPNGMGWRPSGVIARPCSRSPCCSLAGAPVRGNREQGAKLLAAAAKLGHAVAAYDLALLYLEGQMFPQDFGRAAELFRSAAQAGTPGGPIRARDPLQGRPRRGKGFDRGRSPPRRGFTRRQHRCASRICHRAVQRNGRRRGNERLAATLLAKAARKGNPIAQNRLANILAVGRGVQANRGGGGQVAHHRQGRRRERYSPRHIRAEADAGDPRRPARRRRSPGSTRSKSSATHALDVAALCRQTPGLISRQRAGTQETSPGQRASRAPPCSAPPFST